MGKFTLFDFLSFVLPSGSFITLVMFLLNITPPPSAMPELYIIPFLVVYYILGHLLSVIGLCVGKLLFSKTSPWMKYLKEFPDIAKRIDRHCITTFYSPGFIDKEADLILEESRTSK
ncbi:hypothetical protein EYV94_18160 [Puteibacter caeruleilacunae]|nr:hypothetical protein EYV94_18160 [Puteibacter caeruleilacunae]